MKNFVLIGAAGYIAPRHMKAIKETGNNLIAVYDPYDGIGIIDSYFPNADYFKEFERFDRHIEKKRREGTSIDYVSICSPNYLHDSHIRFGLRIGADVICEKPIVLNPWNIDTLVDLEKETGKKVYTILQLRYHPSIVELKRKVELENRDDYNVVLKYITSRGNWYHYSWKGDEDKSGGIATNIGIHFFDMLTWVFGPMKHANVSEYNNKSASGILRLERAEVTWELSIDSSKLPLDVLANGQRTYRSIQLENNEIEFSEGFTDLHTISYNEILEGRGFGLLEAKESVVIASQIRELGSRNTAT
jgi:UDP-N-acetyl-2-amino-2-deoxyglucuronate dehydrogenase